MKSTILCAVLAIVTAAASAQAAPRELTIFNDGTVLEIEATAKRGVAEVSLPAQIREGSLRVKPMENGSIGRVDILPFRMPEKLQKELDNLIEQKSRLDDRLKALETKEGIFAAAAKSQSSKAPRKSKTNPDPMTSVRQGTDYAIAQLEAVFTARRRTEQELKRVEARIAQLRRNSVSGPTIKVSVSPLTASVKLSAILADSGWKPRYDIRLNGNGTAMVSMLADITNLPTGYSVKVIPLSIVTSQPQTPSYPIPPSTSATPMRLAQWNLPVDKEQIAIWPLPGFTFNIRNSTGIHLPSAEATIFKNDEYLGTIQFPVTAPDTTVTISNRQKQNQ